VVLVEDDVEVVGPGEVLEVLEVVDVVAAPPEVTAVATVE
jgi:hypothetical protein